MPRHSYRIEIRDDRGRWVHAPGEATGWRLPEARVAAKALLVTLAHDWPDHPTTLDDIRIVSEQTGEVVSHSAGRPPSVGARRGQVSLNEASWAKARTLGDGNVSAGIRLALSKA